MLKCNKVRRLLVLLFLTTAVASQAQVKSKGREIHVSQKGNDSGNGTMLQPFKTIMAAANVAMPGDVITVHAGVYREEITPPRGGNSDNERIVYQAAPGEKVIIKGAESVKGWRLLKDDTWEAKIPNSFFGKFNPYSALIAGGWFIPTPKDRKYHRGAVYLNGDWLMEAAKKEDVMTAVTNTNNQLWWADVGASFTTIWAQFKGVDPNKEDVEINVRRTVFYPDKPFINYLTVRGFKMEQAATNWAPPEVEQEGLIGTHWSRGWIIENNIIQYSKCIGVSLGRFGDGDPNAGTIEGFVEALDRISASGWNKGTIGGHVVRNNTIAYCEQTGIGGIGGAFSVIENNTIHDIYVRRLFSGSDQGGIKLHGGVDVRIKHNHIYRTEYGIWLDWMAQGAQVENNVMHDNSGADVFIEVDHGPQLISNNILLSRVGLRLISSGNAIVHNIFGGKIEVVAYDSRITPYHLPHATFITAWHDNPGGDAQLINNLFVNGGNVSEYSKALLPVTFDGNVYTKGSAGIVKNVPLKSDSGNGKYTESYPTERNAVIDTLFDAGAILAKEADGLYLKIALDRKWLKQNRKLVTTEMLTNAIVPNLPFENPDGTRLVVDTDYFGERRNLKNPSPGPFEITDSKKIKIKIF